VCIEKWIDKIETCTFSVVILVSLAGDALIIHTKMKNYILPIMLETKNGS
jgi:hypothetical protein